MDDKSPIAEASWWDWAVSTKEKVVSQSTEVMGYVQKDINEFTRVISHEASSVVSSTATILKEKLNFDDHATTSQMKKSVSGFFNHVAQVFTPPPDDSDVQAIMMCNQQPVFLSRSEVAAYQFYSDPSNFLKDDDGDIYETWLLKFNIEEHQHEFSTLLENTEALRQTYSILVPTQMSQNVFWHRYFYKIHKINEAQSMREEMKLKLKNCTDDKQQTLWDEDEAFGGDTDIPELVQKKLLEEYEKERQKGEKRGSSVSGALTPDPSIHSDTGTPFEDLGTDEESITPASSKDTDESWDKLQTLEAELQKESSSESSKEQSRSKSEDWENWE